MRITGVKRAWCPGKGKMCVFKCRTHIVSADSRSGINRTCEKYDD